jgi:hypothetical protein
MEDYIIFDSRIEVAEANGRYLYELYKEGKILEGRKERHNSKESVFLDLGEETKDGKFVCKLPLKHQEKFRKGKSIRKKDKIKVKKNRGGNR